MPWVRLDDQFPDHPKVVKAGSAAAWLYVCGLAYCARHLTDGAIPAAQVTRLTGSRSAINLAERLVDADLWERTPEGYRVHDYLIYNPTRTQVLALRKQKADAGRRGGKQRASTVLAERLASASATGTGPTPTPLPTPSVATSSVDPLLTDTEPPRSVQRERVAPIPKTAPAVQAQHGAIFGALSERFGAPANDAERQKYGKAAKLLAQAGATSDEVFELAETLEQRWPDAECTPLALANNVSTLRTPKNGRREEPDGFAGIREAFADVAPRRALG